MKPASRFEIAVYATLSIIAVSYLGSVVYQEKYNALAEAQTAKAYCYGDYAGTFANLKGDWYATEDNSRKINGGKVNFEEGDRLEIDYRDCVFNYDLKAKYNVPVGLIRKSIRGAEGKIVSYQARGRGYTVTVDTGNGHVDMAQGSYLKQYPFFVGVE